MQWHQEILRQQSIALQQEQANPFYALLDVVAAYNSITVYFSARTTATDMIDALKTLYDHITEEVISSTNDFTTIKSNSITNTIFIPVCYELPYATDLVNLTVTLQLSAEEIVRQHSQKKYQVYMNGFTPGFAYMGALEASLQVPRKKTPSAKVAAGSVAIAAAQTGIYPFETPGGWHVIGRTPLTMFDKDRKPACLLQPGDTVTFTPITANEFENWP